MIKALILLVALLTASALVCAAETPEEFQKRTRWWQDARFGMFIHWGIYSVPADATNLDGGYAVGEWYLHNKKMQMADYEKFASRFNPVKFDAKTWVKIAKDAGMRYIVITSKHHDGFCMWDTKLTDYKITASTPYKHDPIKALAAECRRQGIKLCFYHSIMDWHHPDYLPRREWERDVRPAAGADLNRYIDHMKGQIRELITQYHPGILWFDGSWEHTPEELRSAEVNAFIRELDPTILINDRNKLPEDYATPEQSIPADALPDGRLWETCMTMNGTWGYASNDNNWKSSAELIRMLSDIASKGGNFLLNVGPTSEGIIPQPSVERLADVGRWMKTNIAAIYKTSKSAIKNPGFNGRVTVSGSKLYLHVFDWPADGLVVQGVTGDIARATALLGKQRLSATPVDSKPGAWLISRPAKLDPAATVVELQLNK